MRDNLTHAIEDYLKTIYELTTTQELAPTNQIAEALNITAASVSGMIKRLAETVPPLVEYKKHKGVKLSEEGEKIALEIIRHHRLLELFLHQMLGYSWDMVHEEADKLEHVISEEFEAKIAKALGDPRFDPHGDPIPTEEYQMPITSTTSLADLRANQKATITRVNDKNSDLLALLNQKGVIPQTRITITAYSAIDKITTLRLQGTDEPIVLGYPITKQIFVETEK